MLSTSIVQVLSKEITVEHPQIEQMMGILYTVILCLHDCTNTHFYSTPKKKKVKKTPGYFW